MSIVEKISEIVREAGAMMLDGGGFDVHIKSGYCDLVTDRDVKIQRFLIEKLSEALPGASFLAEEEGVGADPEGFCFVIDPIDGTANFVAGYNCSAVSVGLCRDGVPVAGVVYNPYAGELFSAAAGEGAYLNGKPIRVSDKPLRASVCAVGLSCYDRNLAPKTFALAQELFSRCVDIRRSGSAAVDLCNVACGRAALMYELMLAPWDICAARVIITEAGGVFSYITSAERRADEKGPVAAGSPAAMEEFLGFAVKMLSE